MTEAKDKRDKGIIFRLDCADLPSGDLFTRANTTKEAYDFFMQYIGKSIVACIEKIEETEEEKEEGYYPDLKFGEVIEEH